MKRQADRSWTEREAEEDLELKKASNSGSRDKKTEKDRKRECLSILPEKYQFR